MPGLKLFRATREGAVSAVAAYMTAQVAATYYLGEGAQDAPVERAVWDASGLLGERQGLDADGYRAWVGWTDPNTGEARGAIRGPRTVDGVPVSGAGGGSPLFVERVITAPKSLSMLAAIDVGVDEALAQAMADAADEVARFWAANSYTRVGPKGGQELVCAERVETALVRHLASRDGDPHPHLHLQLSTRVWARGAWRALDTATTLRQIGQVEGIVNATILAHPRVRAALSVLGTSIDPDTGEVAGIDRERIELFSKRRLAIQAREAELLVQWQEMFAGQVPGPALLQAFNQAAWRETRAPKESGESVGEMRARWRAELAEAGIEVRGIEQRDGTTRSLLRVDGQYVSQPAGAQVWAHEITDEQVTDLANACVDEVAALRSAWSRHDLAKVAATQVARLGLRGASSTDATSVVQRVVDAAAAGCLNVLDQARHDLARQAGVRALTSASVIAAEQQLEQGLVAAAQRVFTLDVETSQTQTPPAVDAASTSAGSTSAGSTSAGSTSAGSTSAGSLDASQQAAAAALTSGAGLVVVEGAAGAGKTTMLATAASAAALAGGRLVVVAPTAKAAIVAGRELPDADASTVHGLLYAHGYRWDQAGKFTRSGPVRPGAPRLDGRTRVVVDEAGMVDQDTMNALLDLTATHGAAVGLVGDRSQLGAVGRGGVLQTAASIVAPVDMVQVHRFHQPGYADVTLAIRDRAPEAVERFAGVPGSVLFPTSEDLATELGGALAQRLALEAAKEAGERESWLAITTTNAAAAQINAAIATHLTATGVLTAAPGHAKAGSDGLVAGVGAIIQTRRNRTDLGVHNRETWQVTGHTEDGGLLARNTETGRRVHLPTEYVGEHTHLGWATTVHGAQGVTIDRAVMVVDDTTDAAALYVGITRGRRYNAVATTADTLEGAKQILTEVLGRQHADTGLTAATEHANQALTGLEADRWQKIADLERDWLDKAGGDPGMWPDWEQFQQELVAATANTTRQAHIEMPDLAADLIRTVRTDRARKLLDTEWIEGSSWPLGSGSQWAGLLPVEGNLWPVMPEGMPNLKQALSGEMQARDEIGKVLTAGQAQMKYGDLDGITKPLTVEGLDQAVTAAQERVQVAHAKAQAAKEAYERCKAHETELDRGRHRLGAKLSDRKDGPPRSQLGKAREATRDAQREFQEALTGWRGLNDARAAVERLTDLQTRVRDAQAHHRKAEETLTKVEAVTRAAVDRLHTAQRRDAQAREWVTEYRRALIDAHRLPVGARLDPDQPIPAAALAPAPGQDRWIADKTWVLPAREDGKIPVVTQHRLPIKAGAWDKEQYAQARRIVDRQLKGRAVLCRNDDQVWLQAEALYQPEQTVTTNGIHTHLQATSKISGKTISALTAKITPQAIDKVLAAQQEAARRAHQAQLDQQRHYNPNTHIGLPGRGRGGPSIGM